MNENRNKSAVLLLEDGTIYRGKAAGAIGTTTGEIAFNTGMTGYQEIFTDPSYHRQIVVMNASHIGNYGVHDEEIESDAIRISGMVCKKFSDHSSRPGGSGTLQNYFENYGLVAISDIDTRSLVRHIRAKGAMNAIISSEGKDIAILKEELAKVPSMEGLELASEVSVKKAYELGSPHSKYKVAVIDLGVKKNILRSLLERDCFLKIFPFDCSIEEINAFAPDGVLLSNGPGDPAAMTETIRLAKNIINQPYPTFGICLGHQIIALSQGMKTGKMHHGHRGINHPVINLITGKAEITSQNHGFVVSEENIDKSKIEITHLHLNDKTIAGIRLCEKDVFSVQYHPEACPGPHDSRYLFDDFIAVIKKKQIKPRTIKA